MIKIKKNKYIKVRHCPDCGKLVFIARHPKQERCKTCRNRKHHTKEKKRRRRQRFGSECGANRRFIKSVGYCQLCGSTENLTCHHVGGQCRHKTCLCDECHQNYEKFNNKRKVKQCLRLQKNHF